MERDLASMASKAFDVIVIGAGIHGACVARDAALRGFSVAIIDRGDFCGQTSHNSLKTIHGGIRYIQHLNFSRTIESIKEQSIWLKTAPHLVAPLRFVMPTYGYGLRGPQAMFVGIQLYRAFGLGRNIDIRKDRHIDPGRVVGSRAVNRIVPDLPDKGASGAALWDDAQVAFADRAVLEVLFDAVTAGASAAAYAEVTRLVRTNMRVTGVQVQDGRTGETFEIAGRVVVNAAGPWVGEVVENSDLDGLTAPLTKSMNIVTRKPARNYALSIQSEQSSDSKVGKTKRLFFEIPWLGCAMYGTTHVPAPAQTTANTVDDQDAEIRSFIQELNDAWPSLDLTLDDVCYCYQGYTPATESGSGRSRSHESVIVDHVEKNALEGLVSVIGVKWTTGRLVAERTVDLVCKKLGQQVRCKTRAAPLKPISNVSYEISGKSDVEIEQICRSHIEKTQTFMLRDMLLRRNNDLVRGLLSKSELRSVANTMCKELRWSDDECRRQIDLLRTHWLPKETRAMIDQSTLFESST